MQARWFILCIFLIFTSCVSPADVVQVTIDPQTRFQTWEGSGACLAPWTKDAADLYLSDKWLDAFTKDFGMNILRVGLDPIILSDDGRHTYKPVTFSEDPQANLQFFHYDNPADKRQIIFAQVASALAKRDPEHFKVVATIWTPPNWMKKGGVLTNNMNDSAKGTLDLSDKQNLEQYCRYIVSAVVAFEKASGVPIYALSIQNEPLFAEPYDSMMLIPDQYHVALATVGAEFEKDNMKTLFFGPESVIYGNPGDNYLRNQQIAYCLEMMKNPAAGKYIYAFAAHGYGIQGQDGVMHGSGGWSYYWDKLKQYNKPSWMTETGAGHPKDALSSFAPALMEGMIFGNVSMWLSWQLSDGNKVGGSGLTADDMNSDNVKAAVAKHVFRYIRPGAVRVQTTPDFLLGQYSICSWIHNTALTVVIENEGAGRDFTIAVPPELSISVLKVFQTTDKENFAAKPDVVSTNGSVTISAPSNSMITLTSEQ